MIRVLIGTQIFDADTSELLADLTEQDKRFASRKVVWVDAGTLHLSALLNRHRLCPRIEGTELELRLELNLSLTSDSWVFLTGNPLDFCISRAKPKVADYPYNTQLGVVPIDVDTSFVVYDLPGLIEGAADGHGLCHQFLRHIERTRLFIF